MGTQGSLKYYEKRDPGPHFSMKMGTWGPHFGGSLFSYDTGTEPPNLNPLIFLRALYIGGGADLVAIGSEYTNRDVHR